MQVLDDLLSSDIAQHLGWMLLHSLWLMLIPAVMLALALLAVPSRMSNTRYLLSTLSLLLMAVSLGVAVFLVPGRAAVSEDVSRAWIDNENPVGEALAIAPLLPLSPTEETAANPGNLLEWVDGTAGPPADLTTADTLAPLDPVNQTESEAASGPIEAPLVNEPQGLYTRAVVAAEPYVAWAVPLWIAGVFVLAIWHFGGLIAIHRLRSIGTRQAPAHASDLLHSLMQQMGIKRAVALLESSVVRSPAVIGLIKPVVLIPTSVFTGLTPEQLEAILAHELAHIKRHDYLVNLVQTLVVTLLFYHPAVWWVSKHIRNERECCCDDIVLKLPPALGSSEADRKLDYAKALTQVAMLSNTSRRTHLAVAADSGSLFERIKRMMGMEDTPGSAIGPKAWLAGLLVLLFAIALPITLATGNSDLQDDTEEAAVEDEELPFAESLSLEFIEGVWYGDVREGDIEQQIYFTYNRSTGELLFSQDRIRHTSPDSNTSVRKNVDASITVDEQGSEALLRADFGDRFSDPIVEIKLAEDGHSVICSVLEDTEVRLEPLSALQLTRLSTGDKTPWGVVNENGMLFVKETQAEIEALPSVAKLVELAGIELTNGQADRSKLPGLWELFRSTGQPTVIQMHHEIEGIYRGDDGWVYHNNTRDNYYIQKTNARGEPIYFGPYPGDPTKILSDDPGIQEAVSELIARVLRSAKQEDWNALHDDLFDVSHSLDERWVIPRAILPMLDVAEDVRPEDLPLVYHANLWDMHAILLKNKEGARYPYSAFFFAHDGKRWGLLNTNGAGEIAPDRMRGHLLSQLSLREDALPWIKYRATGVLPTRPRGAWGLGREGEEAKFLTHAIVTSASDGTLGAHYYYKQSEYLRGIECSVMQRATLRNDIVGIRPHMSLRRSRSVRVGLSTLADGLVSLPNGVTILEEGGTLVIQPPDQPAQRLRPGQKVRVDYTNNYALEVIEPQDIEAMYASVEMDQTREQVEAVLGLPNRGRDDLRHGWRWYGDPVAADPAKTIYAPGAIAVRFVDDRVIEKRLSPAAKRATLAKQDDRFKTPQIILGRNHRVKPDADSPPQPEAMLGPYWEASGEVREVSQLPKTLSRISGSRLSVHDVGRRIMLFVGHPDFSGQRLGEIDITDPETGESVLLGYKGGFERSMSLYPKVFGNENGWMVFEAYAPRDKPMPERVDLHLRIGDTTRGWVVHGRPIKPEVENAGSWLGPGVVFTGLTEVPSNEKDDYQEVLLTTAIDRPLCQTHEYRLIAEDEQGDPLHSAGHMSPSIHMLRDQDGPAVMRTTLRVPKGVSVHRLRVERRPIRTVIYRNAALQPGIEGDPLRIEVQPLPVAVDARLEEQDPGQPTDLANAILGKWYVQWSQDRWIEPGSRFSYEFKPSGAIEIVMDGEKLQWGEAELTADTVRLDMGQGGQSLLYNYAINNEGSLILEEKGVDPPTFMILTKEPKGTPHHQQQRGKAGQDPGAAKEGEKQAADDLLQLIAQAHHINESKIKTWIGGALVTDEHVGGPSGDNNMTSLVAFQTDKDQGKRWRWEVTAATKTVDGEQVDDPRQISVQDEMIRGHVHYKLSDGLKRADGPWERTMVILPIERAMHKIGMKSRSLDPYWYLTHDGKPIDFFLDELTRKRDQGGQVLRVTRERSVILIENPLEERQWTRRYRFDLAQGGNLIQVEVNQGKDFWHTNLSYEQVNGTWVPKRYEQKQQTASHGTRRRVVVFRDQLINHPVDEKSFTIEAMGILPGTRVSDHMRGFFYEYPNEQDALRIRYRTPTGQSYTAGGITLHEVVVFGDGGTLATSYTDADGKRVEAAFNGHRHSDTRYRMYSGAMHHTHEGAELIPQDAALEREVIAALRNWVKDSFTDEQLAAIRAKQRAAIEARQRPELAEDEVWAVQILDGLKAVADYRQNVNEQDGLKAIGRDEKQARRITLPDIDEPHGLDGRVLDLRTGKLLDLPPKPNERNVADHFAKLGKGDLIYESASGKHYLAAIRGASIKLMQNADRQPSQPDSNGAVVHELLPTDKLVLVRTAEGDEYLLVVINRGGAEGLELTITTTENDVPEGPNGERLPLGQDPHAAVPQDKHPLVGRWVWCEGTIDQVSGIAEFDGKGGMVILDRDGGSTAFVVEPIDVDGQKALRVTDSNGNIEKAVIEHVGKERAVLLVDLGEDIERLLLFREDAYTRIKEQTLKLRELQGAEAGGNAEQDGQAKSLHGRWFVQRQNGHWMLEDETAAYEFRADGVVAQAGNDEAIRPVARYEVDWEAKQIRQFSLKGGKDQGSMGFSLDEGVLTLQVMPPAEFAKEGKRLEPIETVLTRNGAGTAEHQRARSQAITPENVYARMRSARQIRAVYQGLVIASHSNRGVYPDSIGALLAGEFVTPDYLLVPWSGVEVPDDYRQWKKEDKAKWAEANSSYAFVMPGQKQTLDTERVILFELPLVGGTTMIGVCYDDGHSNYLPYAEADALIKKQTGQDLMGWMKRLGREQRPVKEDPQDAEPRGQAAPPRRIVITVAMAEEGTVEVDGVPMHLHEMLEHIKEQEWGKDDAIRLELPREMSQLSAEHLLTSLKEAGYTNVILVGRKANVNVVEPNAGAGDEKQAIVRPEQVLGLWYLADEQADELTDLLGVELKGLCGLHIRGDEVITPILNGQYAVDRDLKYDEVGIGAMVNVRVHNSAGITGRPRTWTIDFDAETGDLLVGNGAEDSGLTRYTRQPPKGHGLGGKKALLGFWYAQMDNGDYVRADEPAESLPGFVFREGVDGSMEMAFKQVAGDPNNEQEMEFELLADPHRLSIQPPGAREPRVALYAVFGEVLMIDPQEGGGTGPMLLSRTARGTDAVHGRRQQLVEEGALTLKEGQLRMQSLEKIKRLLVGIFAYDQDRDGALPTSLGELYVSGLLGENGNGLEVFASPFDTNFTIPDEEPEGGWADWVNRHGSFVLTLKGDDIDGIENPQQVIVLVDLAYAQGGEFVNLGFADGHVEVMVYDDADKAIKQQTGKSLEDLLDLYGREPNQEELDEPKAPEGEDNAEQAAIAAPKELLGTWYLQSTDGEYHMPDSHISHTLTADGQWVSKANSSIFESESNTTYLADPKRKLLFIKASEGTTPARYEIEDGVLTIWMDWEEDLTTMVYTRDKAGTEEHQAERAKAFRQIAGLLRSLIEMGKDQGRYPASIGEPFAAGRVRVKGYVDSRFWHYIPEEIEDWDQDKQRAWVEANGSYLYLLADEKRDEAANRILLAELPVDVRLTHIGLGYEDGSTLTLPYTEADALIKKQTGQDLMGWMEALGREQTRDGEAPAEPEVEDAAADWPDDEGGPKTLGLQARLRGNRTLKPGETPALTIDLRNTGDQEMRFINATEYIEIRVGKNWYRSKVLPSGRVDLFSLGPGESVLDINWSPKEALDWQDDKGNKLAFGPGEHTVRLAITLHPQNEEEGFPVRLLTNSFLLNPKSGLEPIEEPGEPNIGETGKGVVTIRKAQAYRDGGTIGIHFDWPNGKAAMVAFDRRIPGGNQIENKTSGRLFYGGMHPNNANLVPEHGEAERKILGALRGWLDEHFSEKEIKAILETRKPHNERTDKERQAGMILGGLQMHERSQVFRASSRRLAVYPASFEKKQGDRVYEVLLPGEEEPVYAKPFAILHFDHLKAARSVQDELGKPAVELELKAEYVAQFSAWTEKQIDKPLLITVAGKPISAPVVRQKLTDRFQVIGLDEETVDALVEAVLLENDPWEREVRRLGRLVIKEVGRDVVVQGYEALIEAHPEDERVGEAMLMIAGIYRSISIPEMGIEQDRDMDKHWLERAAAESPEGSLPWIEARFSLAGRHPMEEPAASRKMLEAIRKHANDDSLMLIRVEYGLMNTTIAENDWDTAVSHGENILSWYSDPKRIPEDKRRKSRVDNWMNSSARYLVHQLEQASISSARRETLLQRLHEANLFVMGRIQEDLNTPRWTVQRIVRDYMAAALEGDRKTQERLSVPGKAPAREGGEGFEGLKVDQAWVNDKHALVVTTSTVVQQPPGPETGYIVFELVKDDDAGWRIDDIDFEDERGLEKAIQRFEATHKAKQQEGGEAPAKPGAGDRGVADPEAVLPWGPRTEEGLRCRFVEPEKMFAVGDQPTVQVVVQNASKKPVVWSHLSLFIGIAGNAGWTLTPTTNVSFDEEARYATAGEVTEQLGVVRPGLFGDESLDTYLYLRPGGEATLTVGFPKARQLQLKAGRYQVECQEILWDSVVRERKEMLHCPPVVIEVVEPGEKAPPNVDRTHWPKGEWGPEVDGMQIRLNAKSFHNPGGKVPGLYMDLRNFGEEKMRFVRGSENYAIEVDGVWYRDSILPSGRVEVLPLGPGNRWQDVVWSPNLQLQWVDKDGNALAFGEGGHTIRVAITVDRQDGEEGKRIRLVSNAIQPKAADNQLEADAEARLEAAPKKLRYGDRPLNEYTVEQALRLPMYGYPEWVEAIQKLIRDNPEHPRVDELRYFALMQDAHAQMIRMAEDEPDLDEDEYKAARAVLRGEMIERLQVLTDQVGFDSAAGYKCQSRIAHYYQHETDEPREAYKINLKLVDHPYVRGEEVLLTDRPSNDLIDLECDLRRIKFYEWICATASRAKRDGQGGEDKLYESIGKYGYLVL